MYEKNMDYFSRICYFICLGFFIILSIFFIICKKYNLSVTAIIPKQDIFFELTGYYCPGCGGTRAIEALLGGQILKALYFHPGVVYVFFMGGIYILSHTIGILSKEKIASMRFRPIYFYILIVIILVQWMVKNYFYFRYNIHLI